MNAMPTGRLVILSGPSCAGKSPLKKTLRKFHAAHAVARARHQKGEPSLKDLENIETRASSAFAEMKEAWHFEDVIANHDGEDSDNWEAFYYPVGDARKALDAVAALIEGVVSPGAETWREELLQ